MATKSKKGAKGEWDGGTYGENANRSVYLPVKIWGQIEKLAALENRSVSNMVEALVSEAIKARP